MDQMNLPPDFHDQVEREKQSLAIEQARTAFDPETGMPLVSNYKIDPNTFQTQAETNVARKFQSEQEQAAANQKMMAEQKAQQEQAQIAKIQADNAVRAKSGLAPIPVPQPTIQPQAQQAQQIQQPQQAPQQLPAVPDDPYGAQAMSQAYMQGIGEQKAGLASQYEAQVMEAQKAQIAIQEQQAKQQALAEEYQSHTKSLQQERDSLMKDLNGGHINPNQFWEDKSFMGKLGTAIGLIMGGIGGGLTGQENPAMKFLQAQMDRNINAQRLNLENKHNLLNANRAQFQNERDALDATRIMQNDIVSNQLKLAAAQAAEPKAKAALLMNAGQIDQQSAAMQGQLAARRALMSGAGKGLVDPSVMIRMVVPPEHQKDAYKEMAEAQGLVKTKDNLLSAFDQVEKINTVGGALTSPLQTHKQTRAIIDPLVAQLSKETAGRFTEADSAMVESLFPAKGDNPQTIAIKRQKLQSLISQKMNFPLLKSYGLDPLLKGRYGSGGQSRIQESAPQLGR